MENTNVSMELQRGVLEEFMPSESMWAYLYGQSLSNEQIADLIIGSPADISAKAEWLRKLAGLYGEPFTHHADAVEDAVKALEPAENDLFLLKSMWYDDELLRADCTNVTPYSSLDAVIEELRSEFDSLKTEDYPDDVPLLWYELEKWNLEADGSYSNPYTYTLIEDEIVYFTINRKLNGGSAGSADTYRYSSSTRDLDVPVPFKPGDIVDIDCWPFAPPVQAMIIKTGSDPRELQALYRNQYGKWMTGAVKQGHLFANSYVNMSLLYVIEYAGSIREPLLWEAGALLKGDGEKGKRFWDMFWDKEEEVTQIHSPIEDCGLGDAELKSLMKAFQGNGQGDL